MNIQQALETAAVNAWSGFSIDNTTFGSADCLTMTEEINKSLLFNTSRWDFPFQDDSTTFSTVVGQRTYELDDISKINNLYITGQSDYLKLIDESPFLDTVQGIPTEFYPKYVDNVLNVYLHTIPDAIYTVNVDFQKYKFVLAIDGTEKETFTAATDTLSIPTHLQELFWRCIFARAMQTNNKDETDENYKPIIAEYNEFWKLFIDKAEPIEKTKRMILS